MVIDSHVEHRQMFETDGRYGGRTNGNPGVTVVTNGSGGLGVYCNKSDEASREQESEKSAALSSVVWSLAQKATRTTTPTRKIRTGAPGDPPKKCQTNRRVQSLAQLGAKGRDPGVAVGWRPWPAASSARNRGDVTLPFASSRSSSSCDGSCCRSGLGALRG